MCLLFTRINSATVRSTGKMMNAIVGGKTPDPSPLSLSRPKRGTGIIVVDLAGGRDVVRTASSMQVPWETSLLTVAAFISSPPKLTTHVSGSLWTLRSLNIRAVPFYLERSFVPRCTWLRGIHPYPQLVVVLMRLRACLAPALPRLDGCLVAPANSGLCRRHMTLHFCATQKSTSMMERFVRDTARHSLVAESRAGGSASYTS